MSTDLLGGARRSEARALPKGRAREKLRNEGWADAMKGVEPQSDDPEYLTSYRRAKEAMANG